MMTDTDALTNYAQNQDVEAFRHLVLQYQRLVFASCQRVLINTADAEDATQETFLKLAKNATKIRNNLGGWLHACAVRTSLDIQRSRQARQVREENWAQSQSNEYNGSEFQRLVKVLDESLLELSDENRLLIVTLYLEGKTQDQAARELGISASGVRKRLDKAVDLLRSSMRSKGVTLGVAAVAGYLTQVSAQAAPVPVALTASLTKIGVAGVGKSSTLTIGGIIMTKKIVGIIVVAVAVATVGTVGIIHEYKESAEPIDIESLCKEIRIKSLERLKKEGPPAKTSSLEEYGRKMAKVFVGAMKIDQKYPRPPAKSDPTFAEWKKEIEEHYYYFTLVEASFPDAGNNNVIPDAQVATTLYVACFSEALQLDEEQQEAVRNLLMTAYQKFYDSGLSANTTAYRPLDYSQKRLELSQETYNQLIKILNPDQLKLFEAMFDKNFLLGFEWKIRSVSR